MLKAIGYAAFLPLFLLAPTIPQPPSVEAVAWTVTPPAKPVFVSTVVPPKPFAVPAGGVFYWQIEPEEGVDWTTTTPEKAEFTSPAGKYTLEARVFGNGRSKRLWSGTKVIGDAPSPEPPKPPIDPPKAERVLTVVEDATQRSQETGFLYVAAGWRNEANARGIAWHWRDAASPDVERLRLKEPALKCGLPCVIFQEESGKITRAAKLPTTEAELVKLIGAKP